VTRYRTEYRLETVTKTRPATRTVLKTVYTTRPVVRRFDFPAVHVTAAHAGRLSCAVALPGTPTALVVEVKDEVHEDDLDHDHDHDHDVSHPRAGLTPHRARVMSVDAFEAHMAEKISRALAIELDGVWVATFCEKVETPETAARCLAASGAPPTALGPLARFVGESEEDIAHFGKGGGRWRAR
jgi:hypothetical protein